MHTINQISIHVILHRFYIKVGSAQSKISNNTNREALYPGRLMCDYKVRSLVSDIKNCKVSDGRNVFLSLVIFLICDCKYKLIPVENHLKYTYKLYNFLIRSVV